MTYTPPATPPEQASPQELAAIGQAAAAGAHHAQTEGTDPQAGAAAAAQQEADRRNIRLDPDQVQEIARLTAQMSADLNIEKLREAGAFNPPPPPAPAPTATGEQPEQPPPADPSAAGGQAPPPADQSPAPKRSFAEWLRG